MSIPPEIIENLADPHFYQPSDIDTLLGADICKSLLDEGRIRLGNALPLLIIQLGWVVPGNIPINSDTKYRASILFMKNLLVRKSMDFRKSSGILKKISEKSKSSSEDEFVEKIVCFTTQNVN